MKKPSTRLSDIAGLESKPPCVLTECKLEEIAMGEGKPPILQMNVLNNLNVYVDASERAYVSNPKGELARKGIYRCAAAGSLNVLYQHGNPKGIIPLIMRDNSAPNFSNTLGMSSGVSGDYYQWTHLDYLNIRHGLGKLAITVNGKSIQYQPEHQFEELVHAIGIDHKLRWMNQQFKDSSIELKGVDSVPVEVLTPKNQTRTLEVKCDFTGHNDRYEGIPVIDDISMGIDLVHIRAIDLASGELSIIDATPDAKDFLDRKIYLFREDEIEFSYRQERRVRGAYGYFEGGHFHQADRTKFFTITPVVEASLKSYLGI